MKDSKKIDDIKNSFSKASNVIKENSLFSKQKTPFLIAGTGIFILFMLIAGHHHEKEKKEEQVKQEKVEAASAIIKRQLDALKNQKTGDQYLSNNALLANDDSTQRQSYSKEVITRMNAPTSIYESSERLSIQQENSPGKRGDGIHEATFMGRGSDVEFANQGMSTTSVDAQRIPHPDATIVSGEMLQASLNVAANSDLPGMVTATVTRPAYSFTGENQLIPAGSRLIGQYSSAILQGQSRIFIMWNRVVLPDGISVNINSPDSDRIGQSGEPADYVNRHFWSRFGQSVMLSILSAGVSNVGVDSSDEYNSAQAYRMAVAESLQESAAGTLQQTISQKPTLVRYQGAKINVFIAHDLSFYNVLKKEGKLSS